MLIAVFEVKRLKRLRKMRGENREINFNQRCGLFEDENGLWTSHSEYLLEES